MRLSRPRAYNTRTGANVTLNKLLPIWSRTWIVLIAALFAAGSTVAIARAEEEASKKVLTVGKVGGPEVAVGDVVAANLEAVSKVQFIQANGEVICTKSSIKGKVISNPEKGAGNGVIEIESFTFAECTYEREGKAGVALKVAVEELPLLAETEGTTKLNITNRAKLEMGIELLLETPAKTEIGCFFRINPSLPTKYEDNNSEIEISQKLPGFRNITKCGMCPEFPTWKAKYRPLQDETAGGKRIFIN